jgi:vacuolar protein-sorting-associated protein 4
LEYLGRAGEIKKLITTTKKDEPSTSTPNNAQTKTPNTTSSNITTNNDTNKSKISTTNNKQEKTEKKDNDAKDKDDPDAKLKDSISDCIVTEKPNVKWTDVAGLDKAKEALQEAVILPIKFPQLFIGKRKPWKGILLYGVNILNLTLATWNRKKFFSKSLRYRGKWNILFTICFQYYFEICW